jgi:hypothetical protein
LTPQDFEFKAAFGDFLASFIDTSARTVQELVDFNIEHADLGFLLVSDLLIAGMALR